MTSFPYIPNDLSSLSTLPSVPFDSMKLPTEESERSSLLALFPPLNQLHYCESTLKTFTSSSVQMK